MDIDLPYVIEPIAELQGHEDRVWHVAWNPSKPILASCSTDKTVRLYGYHMHTNDNEPGPEVTFRHLTTIPTGHAKTVRAVAWAPSGNTLATASFDSNIGIWEREAGDVEGDQKGEWECMSLLEGHETECKSVSYSSSGTLLASCSRDKTVWVWEVHPDSDFECVGVLMEHTQDVKCVAWHPTEEILASASYDDTIKLYIDDPHEDWFCFSTLTGHTSTVWSLAWSPCGKYLASASDDRTVRLWRRVRGEGHGTWETAGVLEGGERSVYSVSWGVGKSTVDGSLGWIAITGGDGVIRVGELKELPESSVRLQPSYTQIALLPCAHGVSDVNTVVWCPRKGLEDFMATAGDDGYTRVWRVSPA